MDSRFCFIFFWFCYFCRLFFLPPSDNGSRTPTLISGYVPGSSVSLAALDRYIESKYFGQKLCENSILMAHRGGNITAVSGSDIFQIDGWDL
jgi:hypothetical protein